MDDRSSPAHTAGDFAPTLAQALARLCEAEGVALSQVRSIEMDDDEISVRIERLDGCSRIVTYPVAALLADPTKSWAVETSNSATG
jgi:hypothetical protein